MSWLVAAPLLIPLAGALLAYFVPRPWIGVAGAAALLAAGTLLRSSRSFATAFWWLRSVAGRHPSASAWWPIT